MKILKASGASWARSEGAGSPALPRGQSAARLTEAGRTCGFDVLNIPSIPGLEQGNYADEMHVNASGVPIYTRYLVSQLKN